MARRDLNEECGGEQWMVNRLQAVVVVVDIITNIRHVILLFSI